jgi:hypothetical protein
VYGEITDIIIKIVSGKSVMKKWLAMDAYFAGSLIGIENISQQQTTEKRN